MSSPQDQIEAVLAELTTHRQRSEDLQAELMRRRVTVRSANRLVSVSVDARSSVQGVTFHSTAYARMTPDELGRVITETVTEAQTEMARGVAEKLAPLRGLGRAVRESMTGGSVRPERQAEHG